MNTVLHFSDEYCFFDFSLYYERYLHLGQIIYKQINNKKFCFHRNGELGLKR